MSSVAQSPQPRHLAQAFGAKKFKMNSNIETNSPISQKYIEPLQGLKSASGVGGEDSSPQVYPATLIENIRRSYDRMNGSGQSREAEYPGEQSTRQVASGLQYRGSNNRKLRRDMHGPKASITKSLIEDASEDFSNIEEHLSSFHAKRDSAEKRQSRQQEDINSSDIFKINKITNKLGQNTANSRTQAQQRSNFTGAQSGTGFGKKTFENSHIFDENINCPESLRDAPKF